MKFNINAIKDVVFTYIILTIFACLFTYLIQPDLLGYYSEDPKKLDAQKEFAIIISVINFVISLALNYRKIWIF
jgi:hypothetical protein